MSELQIRMTEIGISQRIAHNLARYKAGQSRAYTVPQFIRECRETMDEYKIPRDMQLRILTRARTLAQEDLIAIRQSKHLSSDGGSEVTAYALLCGVLTKLEYYLEVAASNEA